MKRHVQIHSVKHYTFPIDNIKVEYRSQLFGLSSEEFCGVYEVSDVVVHSNSGLAFIEPTFNEESRAGQIILEESSKDSTDYIVFHPNKTNTQDLFKFEKSRLATYRFDKKVYLLFVRRDINNIFHFLRDDLCPLLLLIQNGHEDLLIIHSRNLPANQLEYLEMLNSRFGIEHMEAPSDTHFRVESPVILSTIPNKKYFRFNFYNSKIEEPHLNYHKQVSPFKDDVDFLSDVGIMRTSLPKNWKTQNKDLIWGRCHSQKVLASKTATQAIEILVETVLPQLPTQELRGEIVYVSRNDPHRGTSGGVRQISNEHEITQRFPLIRVVKWGELSQLEKIEISYNTRILIGLHGAGLAASYFMRKSMVVIEIHPKYFRYPYFYPLIKVLCEAKDLRWIGVLSSPLENGHTHLDLDNLAKAIELAEKELESFHATE